MGADSELPMWPDGYDESVAGGVPAAARGAAPVEGPVPPEDLAQLRATLAELAAGLARVTGAVDRLSARESMTPPFAPPTAEPAASSTRQSTAFPAQESTPPLGSRPATPPSPQPAAAPVAGPAAGPAVAPSGPLPVIQQSLSPRPAPPGPQSAIEPDPQATRQPAPPAQQWPIPQGAVISGASTSTAAPLAGSAPPADPAGTTSLKGSVIPGAFAPPTPPPAFAAAAPPAAQHGSWADTSGQKILGWVGGGVTVLGIVMLLVIAAQQGYFGPVARVMLGVVLGAALLGGGYLLHRRPDQAGLATTVAATGLAAEYLSTIGAVRLVDLATPLVGHIASAVIAGVGVLIAWSWRSPYLAAASFLASGLLAPVVGDGYTVDVYVFELVMVLGGAAGLLLGAGIAVWGGAAIGAGFTALVGIAVGPVEAPELWLLIVMMVVTWGLFVGRSASGRGPVDPGPFPIRPRTADPAQTARDYADFHAHEGARAAARMDRVTAVSSMAVSAALIAIALANVGGGWQRDVPAGLTAAVLALLAGAVAWAAGADDAGGAGAVAWAAGADDAGGAGAGGAGGAGGVGLPGGAGDAASAGGARGAEGAGRLGGAGGALGLSATSMRITAWSASILFAAVALARLLEGDLRSVSWLVLATVVLVVVAVERLGWMLVPALVAAGLALIAAAPALSPVDLFEWPSPGLVLGDAVARRAWAVVLPAGLCVLALSAAAWWASARVTAAGVMRARRMLAEREAAGMGHDRSSADLRGAEQRRTGQMAWALIACALVASYGLLAVTMVLSYAVSPTFTGYQVGQILVTGFVTVISLVLLWQGFRTMLVRLGGLGLAAVAVGKLLIFDTRTLDSLPRAMTVIGVGVLLLIGAVVYLRALRPRAGAAGPGGADPGASTVSESR